MEETMNDTYNITSVEQDDQKEDNLMYRLAVPLAMCICVIAVAVNVKCLVAIRWVRGPVSPTLQLSLSLAAVDVYTSIITLLSLVFNSYLPNVLHISIYKYYCWLVALEALRLGGIITIVGHLTALACNHHLGIVQPLRYPGIATGRNTRLVIAAIWFVPAFCILLYFGVQPGQGFNSDNCTTVQFLATFAYHLSFSMVLIIPLAAMCCIYSHILAVVHAQTAKWSRADTGSCKHKGSARHNRQSGSHRHKLTINVRAVHTTLLILGSFVLLYLPAIVTYLLVCDNCHYQKLPEWLLLLVNLLLIAKPITNPIIYAARMHEVKEATKRMQAALRWRWCNGVLWSGSGPWHPASVPVNTPACTDDLSAGGARTVLCRMASNGSSQPQATATLLFNNDTTVL